MKIQAVAALPFRNGAVIKVTSSEGLVGWGECSTVLSSEQVRDLDRIKGRDVESYDVHRQMLLANPAQGAVNMALLDIAGQAAKAPVYQLLGGATRNKVRAMITAGFDPVMGFEGLRKRGHRAFSVPTGSALGPRKEFIGRLRERLDNLRKQIGEESDIVIDGMGALTPAEAQQVSAVVESFHPLWFDEPCPLTNLGAARKLAEENVTPLGWGRNMTDLAQVQEVLREQMCDVVRLDVGRHGISSIRKAAALAETYYVAVAPFHRGGPIATAAALHLAASIPNFFIQQMPQPEDDDAIKQRAEIVGGEIEKVTDGYLALPTAPGLGIKVNEQALRRYAG